MNRQSAFPQRSLPEVMPTVIASRGHPALNKPSQRMLGAWIVLGLMLTTLCGCFHMKESQPSAKANADYLKNSQGTSITPTTLQASVMRFADEYALVVAESVDDFAEVVGTPEARLMAASIKINQATAAITQAAGQNAIINALDLVVLASVSRMVLEDGALEVKFGSAALPLLETARRLETNSWVLVSRVLTPDQQKELITLIQNWRKNNPNQRQVAGIRFREFAEEMTNVRQQAFFKPTSIFGLLFLDPMAGLDPTVRAIEETRYLAERAMYYGQHLPKLVSWQIEYLALELAHQPASQQILTNATQMTASIKLFAETANRLPELIKQEREAGIAQLLDGVATERTNIMASLYAEEERVRDLLTETRGTLETGQQMANSIDQAIRSLETFVRYVTPNKTNVDTQAAPASKRPFDVLDYGKAADQIGDMANDLNVLLNSANQTAPQVEKIGQWAAEDVESLLRHAFWLGLALILILLSGSVLAGLTYRAAYAKWIRRREDP